MNSKLEVLNRMVGKNVCVIKLLDGTKLKTQTVGFVKSVVDEETLLIDVPLFGEVKVSIWDVRNV